MELYVDEEMLKQRLAEMRMVKDELKLVLNKIESAVLSTNGAWQGDAEKAYSPSKVTTSSPSLASLTKTLFPSLFLSKSSMNL